MFRSYLCQIGMIIILMITADILIAQDRILFGVKGGLQHSWASAEPETDGGVIGPGAFFSVDLLLSGPWSFVVDTGISRKGFSRRQTESDESGNVIGEITAQSRVTYLSLSPHLDYMLYEGSVVPFIGVGPRFDWIADKSPGVFEFTNASIEDDTVDNLDSTAAGFSILAGLRPPTRKSFQWRVEIVYERDITDSFSSFPGRFRNNTILLRAGILF